MLGVDRLTFMCFNHVKHTVKHLMLEFMLHVKLTWLLCYSFSVFSSGCGSRTGGNWKIL